MWTCSNSAQEIFDYWWLNGPMGVNGEPLKILNKHSMFLEGFFRHQGKGVVPCLTPALHRCPTGTISWVLKMSRPGANDNGWVLILALDQEVGNTLVGGPFPFKRNFAGEFLVREHLRVVFKKTAIIAGKWAFPTNRSPKLATRDSTSCDSFVFPHIFDWHTLHFPFKIYSLH